jgi:ABC-2 type transport system ATP-binding protein
MSDTSITPIADSAVIRLDRLTRRFGRRIVLDALDFNVPAGSVVGLLGTNGAGKTTLIKCALGLIRADSGSAIILGEKAQSLSAAAKGKLGYVPQVVALYPWMTVGQTIEYTRAFYPHWNDDLVDDLLRDWKVYAGDKVGALSVGTLQKVAIILALAHEPELLVLDEPAASLDPAARREFLRVVLSIASTGKRTIVFSTHITSDLERVADRVAILAGAKIVYHDELDALKDSIKRLHVSSAAALPASLKIPGEIHSKVDGNEALVSVRNISPAVVEEVRRNYAASVRVEDLNLEDIFLEMQHDGHR